MILEGANKLKEEQEYIIYAINSANAGQYCVVAPKNVTGTYNMLIDVHHKKLFDEVMAGTKTKEELLDVLTKEYTEIKLQNESGMLVVPMLNEEEFRNSVTNLDKQKMFDETKKIGAITSELYKKMTESGIEKQKINQKIMIVEKEAEDEKYVTWLKEQMPNYVEGVSLKKEEKKEETSESPLMGGNIFGTPTTTATPATEPTPAASTPEQVAPTPEVSETPVANDIFNNTQPIVPEVSVPTPEPATVQPAATPVPETNVDIFGVPLEQPTAPVTETPVQQPVATPEPAVETPQPVQSVELEGTTTFSPIPNGQEQATTSGDATATIPDKKNGGFVNLAIMLVILVGVTIVSIELGKFLYSVYGA